MTSTYTNTLLNNIRYLYLCWFNVFHSEEEKAALLATPGEGLLIQGDEDDDLMQLKRQVHFSCILKNS